MLIGAHVSPAGGPAKAVQRGAEQGARGDPDLQPEPAGLEAEHLRRGPGRGLPRGRCARADVEALLIHAVYLLNAASEDPDIRAKTLASLTASLQAGDALEAHAVVLHAGSAKAGDVREAIARAGEVIAEALAESERCALHLENTAGAGGTLGRSFDELAALLEARRRGAPGRLPGLLPPAGLRLRDPAPCCPRPGARRLRRRRRAAPPGVAASQRQPGAARVQPRPPRPRRARRAGRRAAARPSWPSRASRACRACWRRPVPTATTPTRPSCSARASSVPAACATAGADRHTEPHTQRPTPGPAVRRGAARRTYRVRMPRCTPA